MIGQLVGIGRTSDVYTHGRGSVIKVPHPTVPPDWARLEADITHAVHRAGLPAPAVRDLVEVEGRPAIVFARIDGPSMWECIRDRPTEIGHMVAELVRLQRAIHAAGIPAGLPDFVDRLVNKIDLATELEPSDRLEAIARTRALPRGAALLHGDLHPGNVLLSDAGPVAIDWFDAAIGHPVADIVRSTILVRPGSAGGPEPDHLPGASAETLDRIARHYRTEFDDELTAAGAAAATWRAVLAAGRLAEQADAEPSVLHQMWRQARAHAPHSPHLDQRD